MTYGYASRTAALTDNDAQGCKIIARAYGSDLQVPMICGSGYSFQAKWRIKNKIS